MAAAPGRASVRAFQVVGTKPPAPAGHPDCPSPAMTSAFKLWIASLLAMAVFTLLAIWWLDRPIALLVHELFGGRQVSSDIARSSVLSIPLMTACVFVVFGLAALMGRQFSRLESVALLCTVGILAAEAIKDQLKLAFGRTWPDSWAPQITSLIRDHAYGFHFFHGGHSYESFPSGHAAVATAVISILWTAYPRARIAYAICILAADLGLVLLNVHFLSDVLAGTFVGLSAGWFTLAVWRATRGPAGYARFSTSDSPDQKLAQAACRGAGTRSTEHLTQPKTRNGTRPAGRTK